jgi:hypothetical protein
MRQILPLADISKHSHFAEELHFLAQAAVAFSAPLRETDIVRALQLVLQCFL